jgi:hypothetical protein
MLRSLFAFIAIFIISHASLYAQDWKSEDLSFDFSSFEMPQSQKIPVNQLILISPFKAPGRDGVIAPTYFRIIMGYGSLSIFDALGTDEVAGLKRKDAQKFVEDLRDQGKTEKDGAFIAGLTNIHNGNEFFIFFNLERMKHSPGYASRLLAHEPLHMAKLLITTIEKPGIDYIKDPWVNMTDDNEEYFAETLERIAAICTDRYHNLKIFNP